jgi:hypothetical protein
MAVANYVGGDKNVVSKGYVTAAANLVDKTFVCANGAVPANGANTAFAVVERDTANGDLATVKRGEIEVIATGTVTAGAYVQILTSTFTTKDTTGVTGAGVVDLDSTNYAVGRAITGGIVNETVLIDTYDKSYKNG